MKRYLVLAEGHSADAHHGKTMRGFVRYAPHPTVAILDSTRAGEMFEGIPIVGRVADALCYAPTTALVGVAPTGGTSRSSSLTLKIERVSWRGRFTE